MDKALSPIAATQAGYEALLRRLSQRRPEQAALLLANLLNLVDAVEGGSVVVFGDDRIRIRRLPVGGS